jgi:GNAT superfamily N-acetyltransferase
MPIRSIFTNIVHFIGLTSQFKAARAVAKPGLTSHVHIVDGEGLIAFSKLHPFNDNLTKKYDRDPEFPTLLYLGGKNDIFFIICDDKERIIASATLRTHGTNADEFMLSQISVHDDFRNKGYASRLLIAGVEYLNQERPDIKKIYLSPFEEMGIKYLHLKPIKFAPQLSAELYEQTGLFYPEQTLIPK